MCKTNPGLRMQGSVQSWVDAFPVNAPSTVALIARKVSLFNLLSSHRQLILVLTQRQVGQTSTGSPKGLHSHGGQRDSKETPSDSMYLKRRTKSWEDRLQHQQGPLKESRQRWNTWMQRFLFPSFTQIANCCYPWTATPIIPNCGTELWELQFNAQGKAVLRLPGSFNAKSVWEPNHNNIS